MKRVLKWAIEAGTVTELRAGKVVGFGSQHRGLQIWAEDEAATKREFVVFGTGWDIPDRCIHVFTTQDGEFVWHLYERLP